MSDQDQERLTVEAGEHALGLETAEQRTASGLRLKTDRAFLGEVEAWQERLSGMSDEMEEVAPPGGLWHQIEARLEQANPSQAPDNVVEFSKFQRRIRQWQGIAAGAMAIAASFAGAFFFLTPQTEITDRPVLFSTLKTENDVRILAVLDTSSENIRTKFLEGMDPVEGDLELWLVSPDADPASLGLIIDLSGEPTALAAPLLASLVDGSQLAVSLEPEGGSLTGLPTGPIVAMAELETL